MKFIDLFAGIGGFRRGMEMAGHECVGFCEFDKYATASYTAMHLCSDDQLSYIASLPKNKRVKEILNEKYRNGEWYCDDVRSITGDTIPKADCWCFGAPCFVAGTLVSTHRGLVPIEDICVGDFVLTHTNRFKRVTEKMINYKGNLYTIKVQGSPSTKVTGNHRFYVRYKKRKFNSATRNYDVIWTSPEWKAVEDFSGDEYIMFPHNENSCNAMNLTDEECWFLGRFVADGYLQEYERKDRNTLARRTAFCIGSDKSTEFNKHIETYSFAVDSSAGTCLKYTTTDKRLFGLCSECGRGAENKRIPQFVMDLPPEKLTVFIDGYMSGDGCEKDGYFKAQSVSEGLIYQMGQCVLKAYATPFSIHHYKTKDQHIIEGRLVNQKDQYCLQFHKEIKKQNNGYIVDGNLWMPLKQIDYHPKEKEIVYNMEVEDDHSYTANGLAAHNCQDFSVAGKRAGLEGNRSSLVREVFRILKEIGEDDRPEWLVYENVKGMLSSNNGFDFLAILSEMDDLGYDCEWQMYNSKYFVPQNRERVYLVGHLRSRGGREVFPLCSANEANSVPVKILGHHKAYRRNTQIFAQDGITEALSTCQGGGREHYTALPVGFNTMPDGTCRTLKYQYQKNSLTNFTMDGDRGASAVLVKFANGIIGDESDVAQCLSSSGPAKEGMRTHQTMNRVVIPVLTPERSVKRQNGRRFKEDGECSFTLTSIDRHGVAIGIDGDGEHNIIDVELPNGETVSAIWYPKYDCYIAIRKLTPKECFRLQGWSDDYFVKAELVNSDSQLYKQAGNGVTVDVVYDLARRIDVNITVEDINE
jgi:DNA (cytosine-5)-methyltransferase 1